MNFNAVGYRCMQEWHTAWAFANRGVSSAEETHVVLGGVQVIGSAYGLLHAPHPTGIEGGPSPSEGAWHRELYHKELAARYGRAYESEVAAEQADRFARASVAEAEQHQAVAAKSYDDVQATSKRVEEAEAALHKAEVDLKVASATAAIDETVDKEAAPATVTLAQTNLKQATEANDAAVSNWHSAQAKADAYTNAAEDAKAQAAEARTTADDAAAAVEGPVPETTPADLGDTSTDTTT